MWALLILARGIEARDEGRQVYGASLALASAFLMLAALWGWTL